MHAKVNDVRPDDAERWRHYVRGLWLLGLRLEESLALGWDRDCLLWGDLDGGRRPRR